MNIVLETYPKTYPALLVFVFLVALVSILILLMRFLVWLDRPKKRELHTTEDKINAALELVRGCNTKPESANWLQFRNWYPEISEDEINWLRAYCHRVSHSAYHLAVQVQEKQLTQEEFKRILSLEYPQLSAKSVLLVFAYALSESR